LWSWGRNNGGQLGQGNTTNLSSPVQVGSLTTWLNVASGYGLVATKTDGTFWVSGINTYGNLGLGNTTNYSSPKQVGASTTWQTIAANGQLVIALG
jgi:alpha-tubulin suppressor-like RCC1 family protein